MKLRRYRPVAIVLLVLHLDACITWRPSPVEPRQLIEEERANPIRLTLPDGTSVVVRHPRIKNDSIAFVSGVCRRLPGRGAARYVCPTTSLISLDDVSVVEVRQAASGNNAGIALVLLTGFLLIVLAAGFDDWGPIFGPTRLREEP